MIEFIHVDVDDESQRYDTASLPLSIGVGKGSLLQLPDGTEGVHAYIGIAEGVPFLQAAGQQTVFYNNERVTSSRWLYDGDIIYFGSSRIRCHLHENELRLNVHRLHTQAPPQVESKQLSIVPEVKEGANRFHSDKGRFQKYMLLSIGLLFLVLVLLGGFVFTAKSVALRVSPQPDQMDIDGGWFHFKLATRYLMRPGEYSFTAEKTGYQTLTKTFKVTEEQDQMVTFAMQPLPGYLHIDVHPDVPIKLMIDDKPIDIASQNPVELSKGAHQLLVESERYRVVEQLIHIKGAGEKQNLELHLEPAFANFKLDSDPSGAQVSADGQVLGITPLAFELVEGTRSVSLSLDGFAKWSSDVTVVASQDQDLGKIQLPKADGKLILTSEPKGADVTADGVYQGETPLEIQLASGQAHELVLSHVGHDNLEYSLTLQPEEEKKLFLELKTQLGVVVLKMHPADTQVFLDGSRIALPISDGRVTLSAEEHTLEFRRDGYHSQRETIKPRSDLAKELSIHLKSLDDKTSSIETDDNSSNSLEQRVTNKVGQEFQLVPVGQFMMGSDRREQGRRRNETPQQVKLTRAYYLALKEVTNADFQKFNREHVSGAARGHALSEPEQPVVNIAWQQAAAYANWLSDKEGLPLAYSRQGDKLVLVQPITLGYRLPTEAEWVWAARYVTKPAAPTYPWGQAYPPINRSGNYADQTASGLVKGAMTDYNDGFAVSAPVGSFKGNSLGFFDLDGNVSEWVNDVYQVRTQTSSQVEQDPIGPGSGDIHTVRGASWYLGSLTQLRWSYRDYAKKPRIDLGFRLARYAQ